MTQGTFLPYNDDEISITPIKRLSTIRNLNALRQCRKSLQLFIYRFPEPRLNAQCLQNEDTHLRDSMHGGIHPELSRVKNTQHNKVMHAVRLDDECSEGFVAL